MKIVYWIYNFLWGDLLKIPLPGGNTVALSLLGTDSCSGWNLLYDKDKVSADPSFSGYD